MEIDSGVTRAITEVNPEAARAQFDPMREKVDTFLASMRGTPHLPEARAKAANKDTFVG